MPLYEYQCRSCSERVEVIQKMSDPPQSHCAKCGGEMKKLFSSPAIQFKGSGFYKTDYASGTRAEGKDSNTSETKGETKAETKAETKSEGGSTSTTSSGTSSGTPDSGSSSGSASGSTGA